MCAKINKCQSSASAALHEGGKSTQELADLRSAPPRCATDMTNFSCSSGVHRNRDFDAAAAAAPDEEDGFDEGDRFGLPVEAAPVAPTKQKTTIDY